MNIELPADLVARKWLGNPGATEAEILALEARLQTQLPTSYRNFLLVTNGWNGALDSFIYKLWSTHEVDWFRQRNQDWIEAWNPTPAQLAAQDVMLKQGLEQAINQHWLWKWIIPQQWLQSIRQESLVQPPPEITDAEYFIYGKHQDAGSLRTEYLQSALEISESGDSAILLLNPLVKTAEGEWEAWFFANWLPGARRYRSFAELMQDTHQQFVDMLKAE